MKNTADLVAAFRQMHRQYSAGLIDRDILRGWILGLPSYSPPFDAPIRAAKDWFAAKRPEITDDVRAEDLKRLSAVATAGAT